MRKSVIKSFPTCDVCGEILSGCIVVGNNHPECWEKKEELKTWVKEQNKKHQEWKEQQKKSRS